MAADDKSRPEMEDDQLYCNIEATVVSGFEECARGEARELFNTTVKAARGKISWKVPIDRVKEVIKMGSIDNCRVVIHSIPHFGFTNDQHDSIGRLQKMLGDFNWDQGLQVWRQFNEFPHDIPSKPDVVPSPDDLVDVVIVSNRNPPKSSKDKKKKGGRWKKKDQRNSKDKRDGDKKDSHGQNLKETVEGSKVETKEECEQIEDRKFGISNKSNEQPTVSIDENGTKRVFVKQFDPNEPSPEIEIKVLIPGPNESVFPIDIDDKDQREEEPMEVDRSLLHYPGDTPSKSCETPGDENERETFKEPELPEPKSLSSPIKEPSAAISILSSAKDFASSVIERLKSSPGAPSDEFSSPPSCVTPPPTPVQPGLEHFMKSKLEDAVKSSSVDDGDILSENDNQGKDTEKQIEANAKSPTSHPSSFVDNEETHLCEKMKLLESTSEIEICSTPNENENKPANKESIDTKKAVKKERDPTKPTFRVTCNRTGDQHAFDSASAAASLGSAIITYFKWSVDLKNFDIEVLLNIENEEVTVSLGITKMSLHNRNLVAFGPTTLRATICYNMMRLCRIKNGDIICDPMCGTSAIPVEGCLKWVNCFFFGGDYHEKGIERSLQNINALREKRAEEKRDSLKIGTVQWNIENFPLRDNSVDVFVSDLPFGYRMGSRTNNRTLYPSLLNAMARTARNGARACLLTEDKKSLIKALQTMTSLWQRRLILSINMGGLTGFVFLITRTAAAYSVPQTLQTEDKTSGDLLDTSATVSHDINQDSEQIEKSNVTVGESETCQADLDGLKETCQQESVKETCQQESVKEMCQQESVKETCQQESFKETCQQESFKETCQQESVKETCQQESFKETCQQESLKETCQQESVKETCQQESLKETCQQESLKEKPQEKSVKEVCQLESAKKMSLEESVNEPVAQE